MAGTNDLKLAMATGRAHDLLHLRHRGRMLKVSRVADISAIPIGDGLSDSGHREDCDEHLGTRAGVKTCVNTWPAAPCSHSGS